MNFNLILMKIWMVLSKQMVNGFLQCFNSSNIIPFDSGFIGLKCENYYIFSKFSLKTKSGHNTFPTPNALLI